MNAKLKNVFHSAWNEPRQFFSCLALLGLCGLCAANTGSYLVGSSLLFGFVALGCILLFAVSFPAFLLAWIPPIRRFCARLLQRRFLVLGCVVTLVFLFYAIEDWRGRRAWQNFKRPREAQGERFSLAALAPPPVPDDQNFFETPLWSDLHTFRTNSRRPWNDAWAARRSVLDAFGPKGDHPPGTGNMLKGERVDLAAWQAFYRGSNNLFAAKDGTLTNYFPVVPKPQSPAADVLFALSRFSENRRVLITASARPQARFWVDYDAGLGFQVPHLPRLKGCAQYLALHATAARKAGDKETALEDIKLLFRLAESIRDEPTLISGLVHVSLVQVALQPVWEGLADRGWSDADLREIESELGKLDLLANYQTALRGERGCALWFLDCLPKTGLSGWRELADANDAPRSDNWGESIGRAVLQLIPSGWYDQNRRSLCRNYEEWLFPLVDRERRIVSPALAQRSQASLGRIWSVPYDVISRLMLPALGGSAARFAFAQVCVDEARVACALERYRLANGQFPDSLDLLAPAFIDRLPHDLINGQPLKYRRTEDGRFLLYSVGWNQGDDSGRVALGKRGTPDMFQGDWVWRYPAS